MILDRIKIKNQDYEIYDFLKPTFKNYIVLETIKEDKKKTIFICNLDLKEQIIIVFYNLIRVEPLSQI